MTVQQMIKNLVQKGVSEIEIARVAGVNPSSVNRLKNGRAKDTTYMVGKRIERMYESHIG